MTRFRLIGIQLESQCLTAELEVKEIHSNTVDPSDVLPKFARLISIRCSEPERGQSTREKS